MSSNSIISVSGLSHTYNAGNTWAIKNIEFSIQSKGIVALLGSNGAGKSTTMNIICGVLRQTAGTVMLNGVDMRVNPEESKKQLGFLPQEPPLYLDLTVSEYLHHCANLRLMEKSIITKAVEEVMEKVSITHFRNRLIKNLSGGYRQRVGIAQAIVHRPSLVVFDEPTVGLDPNQILEVRNLIKEIALDRAVLFSTHILSEVDLMCKDVLMIEHGQLIFNDTLDAFKNLHAPEAVSVTFEVLPEETELIGVGGIESVEYLNAHQVRLKIGKNESMTRKIIEHSAAKGWSLVEITYEKNSLDSIFATMSKSRK